MDLMDIGLVRAIVNEWGSLDYSSLISNGAWLAVTLGLRLAIHRKWSGRKLGAAKIIGTTSRIRPFVNALAGPLSQGMVVVGSALSGHVLFPLALGFLTLADLLGCRQKIRRFRTQVIVYEKGVTHCDELLLYTKADLCQVSPGQLLFRKKRRELVLEADDGITRKLLGRPGVEEARAGLGIGPSPPPQQVRPGR